MPTPKEIPGFYYDEDRNRYFPVKKWAPGIPAQPPQNNPSTSASASKSEPSTKKLKPTPTPPPSCRFGTVRLLSMRQLGGRSVPTKLWFQKEYMESQAYLPSVWKYKGTEGIADGSIEHLVATVQTPEGIHTSNLLTSGGSSGCVGIYELLHDTVSSASADSKKLLEASCLQHSEGRSFGLLSQMIIHMSVNNNITCMKNLSGRGVMFTTLGSQYIGGTVNILLSNQPVDFVHRRPLPVTTVASVNSTIWTGDISSDGAKGVIGTDQGASLLDLESTTLSWICKTNSAIFSQQFDPSGRLVFCGFRNGTILSVDTRRKNLGSKHNFSRKFKFKGTLDGCDGSPIHMPSTVCGLVLLKTDENYLLASSTDGSMRLWDRRQCGRGAVLSYEGLVNSHTRLQIAVDPTESLVASGGEDCGIRLWSVRSGKMLCSVEGPSSPVVSAFWPTRFPSTSVGLGLDHNSSWGFWCGSSKELLYMCAG